MKITWKRGSHSISEMYHTELSCGSRIMVDDQRGFRIKNSFAIFFTDAHGMHWEWFLRRYPEGGWTINRYGHGEQMPNTGTFPSRAAAIAVIRISK
ncbi:hypothetical protein [Paraburkholderia unamae]|uniref:Uncharacterized protein n=1 Tax=Paraburkholderia unamae TaxID=219649 RepID=A0ACC6RGL5_9BURK